MPFVELLALREREYVEHADHVAADLQRDGDERREVGGRGLLGEEARRFAAVREDRDAARELLGERELVVIDPVHRARAAE